MKLKVYYSIWGILTVLALVAGAVAMIIFPDRTYSEKEKRNLSQAPKLSWDSITDGSFMSGMEDYLADQFPYRDRLVEWKANAERGLGALDSNGVFYCKDGYLMEDFVEKSEENTAQTILALNHVAERSEGVKITMLLVPNAISVYSEKLPKDASVADQNAYMDHFCEGLNEKIRFVDVREIFKQHKDTAQLYYRTDHHWTTDAANLAFMQLAEDMNLKKGDFKSGVVCDSFYGTLSAKSGYQPEVADGITAYLKEEPQLYTFTVGSETYASLYYTDRLSGGDAYEFFLGGNYPEATIRTAVNTTRKLLVIKDSYANCLIPFLMDTYKEIKIVDPRYYAEDLGELVSSGIYEEVLILYNVNTLSADNSLKAVIDF